MPSVSKKQHNLMAAVAKNPTFAKKVGIAQSVGQEFLTADKGKKFGSGGMAKHDDIVEDKKMIKKAVGMHDKQLHGGKKTNLSKLNGGGMARMSSKGEHDVQKKSKRGAEMIKMAGGGYVRAADGVTRTGKTKGTMIKMCGGAMVKGKK